MKILMIMTNVNTYGNFKEATGLWLGEATEFIQYLDKDRFTIDYASPNGGKVYLDPRSVKMANKKSLEILKNDIDFINGLENSKKISEVDFKDYEAIYFTGGHGVMWDFFENKDIAKLVINMIENNKYVLSVCHGIAGLLNIKYKDKYIITGKKITGFTTSEEILSGKKKKVPFFNQKIAKENGAKFKKKRFFKSNVVVDENFITGQNPFSTVALAKKVNEILK
ncbi:ThiJ/PfpI family protein [Spiroplasma chinense]|uniref:ThiJ/PfpI family protein n=1 Tax=Spiroplasma chinense TaxID=216932 RepID=A0A5B9Y4A2_9MOLU|nr:type 1 glutamine amidotransferase domain-containing protein [Spiroplasma chinense]QEH61904.1 ThiJ/PfpI family protein [Spiroplasma chinense]